MITLLSYWLYYIKMITLLAVITLLVATAHFLQILESEAPYNISTFIRSIWKHEVLKDKIYLV